ncbi:uncharacterized protein EKO05_0006624 [Ascochyta rabiei]|uniref:uncharacterized protein n=1 Tax=Didymella rabiei TaxID=5454 RepID=UPI001900BA64|nr:uncharacterized protein EKO05_0006624 [Ascochyta rabiei]UPX16210.1 hypothetical protein EKO05_0006624 [Ascochyta rabiei]
MAITRQQTKRKATVGEPAGSPPPKRPPKSPPKRLQHDSNKRCAFLSLPRELRDEVYKHLLESDSSTTMKQRNFIIKSGLVGTNRQICEEFLDAVLFYAPTINTTVRNHNFAHIVTFLNRLSAAQLARFQSNQVATQQRRRKIRITLTYSPTKQSTRPQLNRWLDRFDDPKRRGAEIQFEYELDRASWRNGGYKQRPHMMATAGPRSNEERRKMIALMKYTGGGLFYPGI